MPERLFAETSAFISYRRSDSDALAGRLRDRMAQALPNWSFFMDVTSIQPGLDFRVAIEEALKQSSLFLLLIGQHWLPSRLVHPSDPIAQEIRFALQLGLRIIPVLINDAKMPRSEEFPEGIRAVAWLNAVELRHSRFDDDFDNLVSVIGPARTPVALLQSDKTPTGRTRAAAIGGVLGLVIGLSCLVVSYQVTGRAASEWIGYDGATLLLPVLVVLGGSAGVFLSRWKNR